MLEKLHLINFKSARDVSLALAPLTVLTGLNGSGKSTILQAIALLRQSVGMVSTSYELSLQGELVRLGQSEDVFFENAATDEMSFEVWTPNGRVKVSAPVVPGVDTLPARIEGDASDLIAQLDLGFQMIQADRITPANRYEIAGSRERSHGWLGRRGEFTIDFLAQNAGMKVSEKRRFSLDRLRVDRELLAQVAPTDGLLDQTTGWLQHLSPGVRPATAAVELADAMSLRYSYTGTAVDSTGRSHRAGNVGFGLTYCLPIIVSCLAAPAGAVLLLENPEAHLHPRGQSALGELLVRCAADGVQLIVETHSDHVINGIRTAVKRGELSGSDVAAHFFRRDVENGESSITTPVLFDNGRFSEWPEDFFDEWDRALDQLLDA